MAAIVGWLAWFAVVEHVTVGLFPAVGRWLPFAAGSALVRPPNSEKLLAPLTAAVVLTAYAACIVGAAIFSERYRDA